MHSLRITGFTPLSGVVDAPPSLYACTTLLALAAVHGGEVAGLPHTQMVSLMLTNLQRLGFNVEMVSADTVRLEPPEPRPRRRRVVVSVGCSPVLLAFTVAVAAAAAPPGMLVVVRGECEWMLKTSLRPVIEPLASAGVRLWPGEGLSSLIVMETPGPERLRPGFWRAPLNAPGYVGAALAVAASTTRDAIVSVVGGEWRGRTRLSQALDLMTKLGFQVEERGAGLVVRETPSKLAARVPGGYYEAAVLAVAVAATGGTKLEVRGLPPTLGGEEESVAYILEAWGLTVEKHCSKTSCTLRVEAEPGSLRGFTVSARDYPPLALLASYMAASSRATVTVGEADTIEDEGARLKPLLTVLDMLGVPAEQRETTLEVHGAYATPPLLEPRLECRLGDEHACVLALLASLGLRLKTRIDGSELMDNVVPGLVEKLWMLGAKLEEV